MKRWMQIAMIIATILLLSACSKADPEAPKGRVDAFLTHLQRGEYEEAENLAVQDSAGLLRDGLESFEVAESHFVRALQSFTYTIQSVEEKEDEAVVTVKGTYKNMVPVMASVREDLAQRIIVDPEMQKKSDEQMQEIVNELLSEAAKVMEMTTETVTKEFPVSLKKTEDGWRVVMEEEELVRMLTGNLFAPRGAR